jgi:hypothetical protein
MEFTLFIKNYSDDVNSEVKTDRFILFYAITVNIVYQTEDNICVALYISGHRLHYCVALYISGHRLHYCVALYISGHRLHYSTVPFVPAC